MTMRGPESGPKVYVVSLARATERREAITEQLLHHGIDFAFVDAVDASEVSREHLLSRVDQVAVQRNIGRPLAASEIACILSHRLVYRDIIEAGGSGAIVLEDDAILQPTFVDALVYFREMGVTLSDICAIYHLSPPAKAPYLALRKRRATQVSQKLSFCERINGISANVWLAVGYYVTRAAAVSLLASERVETVADDWSYWARKVNGQIFVSIPPAVLHPPNALGSGIEPDRLDLATQVKSGSIYTKCSIRRLLRGAHARLLRYVVIPLAEKIL